MWEFVMGDCACNLTKFIVDWYGGALNLIIICKVYLTKFNKFWFVYSQNNCVTGLIIYMSCILVNRILNLEFGVTRVATYQSLSSTNHDLRKLVNIALIGPN